jgi:hypothetical protein
VGLETFGVGYDRQGLYVASVKFVQRTLVVLVICIAVGFVLGGGLVICFT